MDSPAPSDRFNFASLPLTWPIDLLVRPRLAAVKLYIGLTGGLTVTKDGGID